MCRSCNFRVVVFVDSFNPKEKGEDEEKVRKHRCVRQMFPYMVAFPSRFFKTCTQNSQFIQFYRCGVVSTDPTTQRDWIMTRFLTSVRPVLHHGVGSSFLFLATTIYDYGSSVLTKTHTHTSYITRAHKS